MRFSSTIEIRDGNPYVLVSAARAKRLAPDWRKPLPVLLCVNGQPQEPWRIDMMATCDGNFYLYLHGDARKASATRVGDRVRLELSFDAEYRSGPMQPMPAWFDEALRGNARALRNWEALVPSRKKEILRYLARLKSPQARARNLERVVHVLAGNAGRFMGRDWERGA